MHPYATDSNERKYVPFFLAVFAVVATWGLSQLLDTTKVTVAWWFDAPSTMAFYGIFYNLFDRKLWRIQFLHQLRLIKVPILEGEWSGYITSSFDQHTTKQDVEVRIFQSWTRVGITLISKNSKSYSRLATILTDRPDGMALNYEYQNEPMPYGSPTMEIHQGAARLVLSDPNILAGDYYSGRGRQTIGSIYLKKIQPGVKTS